MLQNNSTAIIIRKIITVNNGNLLFQSLDGTAVANGQIHKYSKIKHVLDSLTVNRGSYMFSSIFLIQNNLLNCSKLLCPDSQISFSKHSAASRSSLQANWYFLQYFSPHAFNCFVYKVWFHSVHQFHLQMPLIGESNFMNTHYQVMFYFPKI